MDEGLVVGLRDWLAGQAMAALIAKHPPFGETGEFGEAVERNPDGFREALARGAYAYADAMIEEREKGD